MPEKLVLMSHHLCPYVQRAAIALDEKGMDYVRIQLAPSADPPDRTGDSAPVSGADQPF